MNGRSSLGRVGHRIVTYAMITAVVQGLLGIMLYSAMYGRGPFSLLFLMPMANIAYPMLLQNAIRVELWPEAVAFGTFFMFCAILTIGEAANWLKEQRALRTARATRSDNSRAYQIDGPFFKGRAQVPAWGATRDASS